MDDDHDGLRDEDEFVKHKILDAIGDLGRHLSPHLAIANADQVLKRSLVQRLVDKAHFLGQDAIEQRAPHSRGDRFPAPIGVTVGECDHDWLVQVDLAAHEIRVHHVRIDQRHRGLVAARLDSQDLQAWTSS